MAVIGGGIAGLGTALALARQGHAVEVLERSRQAYELLGWAETKVIIRFWLIGGALTLIALGLFYGDYVNAVNVP